jgi:hypothetical protein
MKFSYELASQAVRQSIFTAMMFAFHGCAAVQSASQGKDDDSVPEGCSKKRSRRVGNVMV